MITMRFVTYVLNFWCYNFKSFWFYLFIMSNLRTFGDLKKSGDDKDKKNRESYVGGEKSGLMVEDDRKSI